MRRFFRSYWKTVLVLVVLAALAALTISTSSSQPQLSARLHTHARALASANYSRDYIEATLAGQGYLVQRRRDSVDGQVIRYLEASRSSVQPHQRPSRTLIVGTGDGGRGAAAVLELARLLRELRPSAGAELRLLFFAGGSGPGHAGAGGFIAFIGAPQAAELARQTLSAFRAGPAFAAQGLATPAYVQGVTLSSPATHARSGYPVLLLADTGFQDYPYRAATAADADYADMARAVTGLSMAIPSLIVAPAM